MTAPPLRRNRLFQSLGLPLGLLACGNDPTTAPAGDAGERPAVLVATQVQTPDVFTTYAGVFPDVPSGELDDSVLREFGNANVSTYGGYVFVEEEGTMTRFSVNDDYQLVNPEKFSWADFGIPSINAFYTVFVNATRAYSFAPELGVVLVWDPEAMELTGSLSLDLPERPADYFTYAYDGELVGDHVIWSLVSDNWDDYELYPAVTVAIAEANTDAPVRFVEDARCLPGGPSRVDEHGDYYLQAGGSFGFFTAYGDHAKNGRTCLLRIRAGETSFDPDYLADFEELTGSYATYPWVHVEGTKYVARAWDPEVPFPEDPELYWDNEAIRPLLVDVEAGTSERYPELEGGLFVSGIEFNVDGKNFFELSQTGYVEGGNADIVELHPTGTVKRFHLSGSLLALARVR